MSFCMIHIYISITQINIIFLPKISYFYLQIENFNNYLCEQAFMHSCKCMKIEPYNISSI